MSTLVNWNGQQYLVPAYNDTGYAQGNGNLSQYLVAISTGSLQQVGGLFQLTADADFGPNFGLVSSYFKSRSANIASAGVLRLANTDAIKWRNSDNSADVTLAMNATGTAARTYTIPDLATSYFVMSEGTQSVNGTKTFADLRGTLGANLAAGGFKLTGLAAGSGNGDSLRYEQLVGAYLPLGGGTLTGNLVLPAGSAAAPSLTFGDSDTGIYSTTTNSIFFATNGLAQWRISNVGEWIPLQSTGIIYLNNGTAAAPSLAFNEDTDTGIYLRSSGNGMAFSFNGTLISSMTDSGTTFHTGPIAVVDGSAATPPFTFLNDRDTGLYLVGTNTIGFSTLGTQRAYMSDSSFVSNLNFYAPNGSATNPSLSFAADSNTGLYSGGADTLSFSAAGSSVGRFQATSFQSDVQFQSAAGTLAAPAYAFTGDTNSGMYLAGGDDVRLGIGGVISLIFQAGATYSNKSINSNGPAGFNLGDAANYWNDVSYKTITDRGCLPFCDDGVELSDGKIVSDTEAIKSIQKHPTKKTVHGLPMLDYKTFPKKAYKPADDNGVLIARDGNDEPIGAADGIEMTMMFGVFIGAIKELTNRIEKLEQK